MLGIISILSKNILMLKYSLMCILMDLGHPSFPEFPLYNSKLCHIKL